MHLQWAVFVVSAKRSSAARQLLCWHCRCETKWGPLQNPFRTSRSVAFRNRVSGTLRGSGCQCDAGIERYRMSGIASRLSLLQCQLTKCSPKSPKLPCTPFRASEQQPTVKCSRPNDCRVPIVLRAGPIEDYCHDKTNGRGNPPERISA